MVFFGNTSSLVVIDGKLRICVPGGLQTAAACPPMQIVISRHIHSEVHKVSPALSAFSKDSPCDPLGSTGTDVLMILCTSVPPVFTPLYTALSMQLV